jgi:hypothetical protein
MYIFGPRTLMMNTSAIHNMVYIHNMVSEPNFRVRVPLLSPWSSARGTCVQIPCCFVVQLLHRDRSFASPPGFLRAAVGIFRPEPRRRQDPSAPLPRSSAPSCIADWIPLRRSRDPSAPPPASSAPRPDRPSGSLRAAASISRPGAGPRRRAAPPGRAVPRRRPTLRPPPIPCGRHPPLVGAPRSPGRARVGVLYFA